MDVRTCIQCFHENGYMDMLAHACLCFCCCDMVGRYVGMDVLFRTASAVPK